MATPRQPRKPRKLAAVPTLAATTVEDVIAAVPALGPWAFTDGPLAQIRNASGDCPLIAFARDRGRWVGTNNGAGGSVVADSGRAVARQIGLPEDDGDDLADAADGLAETYAKFEFDVTPRIVELRARLLTACGLAERPRDKSRTRRPHARGNPDNPDSKEDGACQRPSS